MYRRPLRGHKSFTWTHLLVDRASLASLVSSRPLPPSWLFHNISPVACPLSPVPCPLSTPPSLSIQGCRGIHTLFSRIPLRGQKSSTKEIIFRSSFLAHRIYKVLTDVCDLTQPAESTVPAPVVDRCRAYHARSGYITPNSSYLPLLRPASVIVTRSRDTFTHNLRTLRTTGKPGCRGFGKDSRDDQHVSQFIIPP